MARSGALLLLAAALVTGASLASQRRLGRVGVRGNHGSGVLMDAKTCLALKQDLTTNMQYAYGNARQKDVNNVASGFEGWCKLVQPTVDKKTDGMCINCGQTPAALASKGKFQFCIYDLWANMDQDIFKAEDKTTYGDRNSVVVSYGKEAAKYYMKVFRKLKDKELMKEAVDFHDKMQRAEGFSTADYDDDEGEPSAMCATMVKTVNKPPPKKCKEIKCAAAEFWFPSEEKQDQDAPAENPSEFCCERRTCQELLPRNPCAGGDLGDDNKLNTRVDDPAKCCRSKTCKDWRGSTGQSRFCKPTETYVGDETEAVQIADCCQAQTCRQLAAGRRHPCTPTSDKPNTVLDVEKLDFSPTEPGDCCITECVRLAEFYEKQAKACLQNYPSSVNEFTIDGDGQVQPAGTAEARDTSQAFRQIWTAVDQRFPGTVASQGTKTYGTERAAVNVLKQMGKLLDKELTLLGQPTDN